MSVGLAQVCCRQSVEMRDYACRMGGNKGVKFPQASWFLLSLASANGTLELSLWKLTTEPGQAAARSPIQTCSHRSRAKQTLLLRFGLLWPPAEPADWLPASRRPSYKLIVSRAMHSQY